MSSSETYGLDTDNAFIINGGTNLSLDNFYGLPGKSITCKLSSPSFPLGVSITNCRVSDIDSSNPFNITGVINDFDTDDIDITFNARNNRANVPDI